MNNYIIFTKDILEIIATHIDNSQTWLNFALSCKKCRKICNKEYLKFMKFPDFTFTYVFLMKEKDSQYKIGRQELKYTYIPIKYSLRELYNLLGLDISSITENATYYPKLYYVKSLTSYETYDKLNQ